MKPNVFLQGTDAEHGARAYGGALAAAGGQLVAERLLPHERSAVGVALYESPPYELLVPALGVSRLSIMLAPARLAGGLEGHKRQVFRSSCFALFLTPAGAASRWCSEWPGRHLSLFYPDGALQDSCKQGLHMGGEPLLNEHWPGVRSLADDLLAELQTCPLWAAEAADSLGRLLLINVARHRIRHRATSNPLTPQLMARLVDYVQAHLAERLLVSELAAVVGLQPNQFARAYMDTAKQTPHQFVLAQRLQRALLLMHEDRLPLAQVAADCGFASQQHLTQVMRKRLGVTPARYRRERQTSAMAPTLHTEQARTSAWLAQAAA